MDFFDRYIGLCTAIQKAISALNCYPIHFFCTESVEKTTCSFTREALTSIDPSFVEQFIKEGCKLFFRTKMALIREFVEEEKKGWSKGYKFELEAPFEGYSVVEGSPFEPPEDFYALPFTELAQELEASGDLLWVGGSLMPQEVETYTPEDIVAVTLVQLCSALFGVHFLDFIPREQLRALYNTTGFRDKELQDNSLIIAIISNDCKKVKEYNYIDKVVSKIEAPKSNLPSLYLLKGMGKNTKIIPSRYPCDYRFLSLIGLRLILNQSAKLALVSTSNSRKGVRHGVYSSQLTTVASPWPSIYLIPNLVKLESIELTYYSRGGFYVFTVKVLPKAKITLYPFKNN